MWLSLFSKPVKDKVNVDITVTIVAEVKSLVRASVTEMKGMLLQFMNKCYFIYILTNRNISKLFQNLKKKFFYKDTMESMHKTKIDNREEIDLQGNL